MISSRLFVAGLLKKMDFSAYSNIILDKALSSSEMSLQDKKFSSALFYGVIERKITLDHIISNYSSKPVEKLDKAVLQILRIGIYQLLYMDSVPESAAVNESVKLAEKCGCPNASGFINAVLRNFIRADMDIKLPTDWKKNISIKYSCPVWLVEKWEKEFGREDSELLCQQTIGKSDITIRVNVTKITDDDLISVLKNEGFEVKKNKYINNCLDICSGSLENSAAYKAGLFHVQDLSSQLCCLALEPKKGETILDLCAAPGGKSFTIAELSGNCADIFSYDLHDKRVKLIKEGAERLGLKITPESANAKIFNNKIPLADKILCDVPCSGLGVIRKKPEIKYKDPDDFKNLPIIQYDILENASKYLKIGGELIYSTCSLNGEENQDVIEKFLSLNENFAGVSFLTDLGSPFGDYKAVILPKHFDSDGFFISKIKKIR